MQLKKAERKKVKIRLNIASPSGYGKTYGALLLAYGLTDDWHRVAIIDTENESACLYSHLGEYKTLSLAPPCTPDRYIQAIKICEDAGMEVIIVDSITHVWKGQGGLLEYHAALGGKYQDWAKATPLYQRWLDAILQSQCHVITTNRKKQAYNVITEGTRTKVIKVGLEDEIRDGYEYEMTIAFEIVNDKHVARASKDRTELFSNTPEFVITADTGKQILKWCNEGKEEKLTSNNKESSEIQNIQDRIRNCSTVEELLLLYQSQTVSIQQSQSGLFTQRRQQLAASLPNQSFHISNQLKSISNGTINT